MAPLQATFPTVLEDSSSPMSESKFESGWKLELLLNELSCLFLFSNIGMCKIQSRTLFQTRDLYKKIK